jgi:hypothetical protein
MEKKVKVRAMASTGGKTLKLVGKTLPFSKTPLKKGGSSETQSERPLERKKKRHD